MGRYRKGRGRLQRKGKREPGSRVEEKDVAIESVNTEPAAEWRGFEGPRHLVHFLSTTDRSHPHWQQVIRTARDFLDERKVPDARIQKNHLRMIEQQSPHELGANVMHEWRRAKEGSHKGAGIWDAIKSVFSETKHLLGAVSYTHLTLPTNREE